MSLCSVCKECFAWAAGNSEPGVIDSKSHHLTHRDWMQAVVQGCGACTLLRDTLSPGVAAHLEKFDLGIVEKKSWPTGKVSDSFLICETLDLSPEYPDVGIRLSCNESAKKLEIPLRKTSDVVIVQSDLCHGSVASPLLLQERLGPSTDSHTAWGLMRHWISQCKQKHLDLGLRTGVGERWYPTRLLDLGHVESISTPRLIETAASPPQGPYLTLSHCWGKEKHICAMKGNLQNLCNGVSNLPQTFRDAIAATRSLGYRYLWIDSLCIVQDDTKDWARESALMNRVYTEAECNLAAAASEDSSGGLFRKREGLHGQCVARNEQENAVEHFVDHHLFWREVMMGPLQMVRDLFQFAIAPIQRVPNRNKRAWVHQEWLMSKRTIHFAHNQVFWECDHLCACEVFPEGLPNCIRYEGKRQFAESLSAASRLIRGEMNADTKSKHQASINLWLSLIMDYTSRKLTKSTDRLPALAGIASWVQPLLGKSEYLAGLWNNGDLHLQLTWRGFLGTPRSPRPPYRAPSWSWASVEGSVLWECQFPCFTPQSEIIEAVITRDGNDPTGPVTGGHLRVRGKMSRVNILDRETHAIVCGDGDDSNFSALFEGFDVSGLQFGLYYVLLLGTATCEYGDTMHEHSSSWGVYLVLRPIMEQFGTFERCGMAVGWPSEPGFRPALTSRVPWSEQNIPCEEYSELDDMCRIRII